MSIGTEGENVLLQRELDNELRHEAKVRKSWTRFWKRPERQVIELDRKLKEAKEECLDVLKAATRIMRETVNPKDAIGKRVSTLAIARMLIDLMRE